MYFVLFFSAFDLSHCEFCRSEIVSFEPKLLKSCSDYQYIFDQKLGIDYNYCLAQVCGDGKPSMHGTLWCGVNPCKSILECEGPCIAGNAAEEFKKLQPTAQNVKEVPVQQAWMKFFVQHINY